LFIHNPGHVFTKDVIIDRVWPLDSDVMYNTVEAHVSGVRKKMKKVGSRPRIVTIRGVGYKLEE
jgi:DNA-binding response OmpR family regulator